MHLTFWKMYPSGKRVVSWELMDDQIVATLTRNSETSQYTFRLADITAVGLRLADPHATNPAYVPGMLHFTHRGEKEFLLFDYEQRYEADEAYLYVYENSGRVEADIQADKKRRIYRIASIMAALAAVVSFIIAFSGKGWMLALALALAIASLVAMSFSGKEDRSQTNAEYEEACRRAASRAALTVGQPPLDKNEKPASVVGRAVAGGIIAGPAGAVVGALSAVDKNNRVQKK